MRRPMSLLGCIVLIAACAGCVGKRLLLVTQYPAGSTRVDEITEAIREVFDAENMPYRLDVFNMSTVTPARGRVLWGGSGESCRVCVWARPGRGGVLDPPQPLILVMSFVRKLFKTRDVWDAL